MPGSSHTTRWTWAGLLVLLAPSSALATGSTTTPPDAPLVQPAPSCARRFDTSEILDAAGVADAAVDRMDATAFLGARATLRARLACASEALSPEAIARVHRAEALGALVDKRDDRVVQALAGLFAAEPGHQIPATLVPDDHPVRAMIPRAMLALREDATVELPRSASGWIEADGAWSLAASSARASLLQQIDGQGAVLATHYRWPDEEGFAWVVEVAASEESIATPTESLSRPWRRRGPLLAGAAASVGTAAVLAALAGGERAAFDGSPTLDASASGEGRDAYRAELERRQGRANGMTYGSWVAAGAAMGLGVALVIAW